MSRRSASPALERPVRVTNDANRSLTLSVRCLDSLNHLFMRKDSDNQIDAIYESIDHSPLSSDPKNKPSSGNTFFSKTKDKFVTAVNKLVDNYGNLPKKQTYVNTSQTRSSNSSNSEQTVPTSPNEHKAPSTKRPAPIAEHILRRQEETRHGHLEVTYENAPAAALPTPVPNRSSTSSSTTTSAKHSVIFAQ